VAHVRPLTRAHARGGAQQTVYTCSVDIRPEWAVVEQIPFASLAKLSTAAPAAEDLLFCGEAKHYDKAFDRVTPKEPRPLQRTKRVFRSVTTSEDPVIKRAPPSCPDARLPGLLVVAFLSVGPLLDMMNGQGGKEVATRGAPGTCDGVPLAHACDGLLCRFTAPMAIGITKWGPRRLPCCRLRVAGAAPRRTAGARPLRRARGDRAGGWRARAPRRCSSPRRC